MSNPTECQTCEGTGEVYEQASAYDMDPPTKRCPDCAEQPDPDAQRDAMQDRDMS